MEFKNLMSPLDLSDITDQDELMNLLDYWDDTLDDQDYPTEEDLLDIFKRYKGKVLNIKQFIKKLRGYNSFKNVYCFINKEKEN